MELDISSMELIHFVTFNSGLWELLLFLQYAKNAVVQNDANE